MEDKMKKWAYLIFLLLHLYLLHNFNQLGIGAIGLAVVMSKIEADLVCKIWKNEWMA
jgi:hypothetical protein